MKIEPSVATLGAIVSDIDLRTLTHATFAEIEAVWDEYGVLVFAEQHLSDEEHITFTRHFGRLEAGLKRAAGGTGLGRITNVKADGGVAKPDSLQVRFHQGNLQWHSDSSYKCVGAKASLLAAHVVPNTGGETEWADMRAAYTALPEAERTRLAGLRAYHSLYHSQSTVGQGNSVTSHALKLLHSQRTENNTQPGYSENDGEPPLRALIKVHPETEVPALYIGRHAYDIVDMAKDASAKLLASLVAFACQAPRVLTHRWRPGDAVMWDNRCVLHRARPWEPAEARAMFHTRVAGDPATETAENKAA